MPSIKQVPSRVTLDQARISYDTEDQGFKVGILIDAGSHDSPLLLGLEWIKRGTEPVSWTADEKSHEVHFIVQGHLKISSSDGASAVLDPQDSYYFPPGRTYTVENAGDEDVFLVWSITPSPGYQDAEA